MISRTTYLNMTPYASTKPIIYVSQYDVDTGALHFYLFNDGASYSIPGGYSVYIVGAKPDNTVFSYTCSYSGNHVTADLKEQMTLIKGDVTCELSIQKDSQRIGTFNFILRVEESPYYKATLSRTDIDNLHTIIQLATIDATKRAETAANSANKSSTDANASANAAAGYASAASKSHAETLNAAIIVKESMYDTKEEFESYVSKTSDEFKQEAAKLAEQYSREAVKDSESWAVGGTGTRTGEDMDNSKYYSEVSKTNASAAEEAAKLAKDYSTIVMPDLYLDVDTGIVYEKTGVGIDVQLDEDTAKLYWKITVG